MMIRSDTHGKTRKNDNDAYFAWPRIVLRVNGNKVARRKIMLSLRSESFKQIVLFRRNIFVYMKTIYVRL